MNVVVIDYGLCNLRSVHNALKSLGVESVVTPDPKLLDTADALILPGVGAFEDGMKGLTARGFIGPLHDYVQSGRPLLGICLGMQLLFDKSYEFGEFKGLGLIPGAVVPVRNVSPTGIPLKIPHIGWNALKKASQSWEGSLLNNSCEGVQMYFVHSFQAVPSDPGDILAETYYGGHKFCSVAAKGNVCGCQFHPEKSASDGLHILRNFVYCKGDGKNA